MQTDFTHEFLRPLFYLLPPWNDLLHIIYQLSIISVLIARSTLSGVVAILQDITNQIWWWGYLIAAYIIYSISNISYLSQLFWPNIKYCLIISIILFTLFWGLQFAYWVIFKTKTIYPCFILWRRRNIVKVHNKL